MSMNLQPRRFKSWLQSRAAARFSLLVGHPAVNIGCDRPTEMQLSSIRVLVLRAHLLEMIISIAFIGVGLFMWSSMGHSNADVYLLTGAALLVAGAMVFLFAMKSILKYTRR
jgi:hypothetical protein